MILIKSIEIILISIILLFDTIVEGYKPLARYGHGSIVLENKLYFFGGYVKGTDGKEINTNDFFYIDLSYSLDGLNPQYIDLTTITNPPVRFSQGSLTPSSQGNGFHAIGGVLNDVNDYNKPFYDNFVYEYEESTKKWSVPKFINSPKHSQLKEFNSVCDGGKPYIFGGINTDNPETISEMQIFDSESLSWSLASNEIPNLQQSLSGYTATLLPDGIIVYLGGSSNPLSDIYTYNTKNDIWKYTKVDAQGIDSRRGHTAVLASDNRIIVYGGVRDDDNSKALPQLVVLDTLDTNDYKWIIPNTEKIESRELHTANMVGDYMIISFGKFSKSNNPSDEIQILDTRTYEWVNSISLETAITKTSTKFVKRDDGTSTTSTTSTTSEIFFPTYVISSGIAQAENDESESFFKKVPKYIQAVIFCLGGLVVITAIFLTYYSIRQKKKAKTRRLSVLPYTNCAEEAKEDIIYEYMR